MTIPEIETIRESVERKLGKLTDAEFAFMLGYSKSRNRVAANARYSEIKKSGYVPPRAELAAMKLSRLTKKQLAELREVAPAGD